MEAILSFQCTQDWTTAK